MRFAGRAKLFPDELSLTELQSYVLMVAHAQCGQIYLLGVNGVGGRIGLWGQILFEVSRLDCTVPSWIWP